MSDARMFTSYEPSCQYEAKFARKIGADSNMTYRLKLSKASAKDALDDVVAHPLPGSSGSTVSYTSYKSSSNEIDMLNN